MPTSVTGLSAHRAASQRAILDAARELLRRNPTVAPSMADVAEIAGMSRPAVYQYFASRHDLLQALVLDAVPRWSDRISAAMNAAPGPAEAVVAFALENLRLVDEGEHAVGSALAALVPDTTTAAQAMEMHEMILAPLVHALGTLGAPNPAAIARLVNGLIFAATKQLDGGAPIDAVEANLRLFLEPFTAALPGPPRL